MQIIKYKMQDVKRFCGVTPNDGAVAEFAFHFSFFIFQTARLLPKYTFGLLGLTALIALDATVPACAQSLFSDPGQPSSLYQDRRPTRASKVGDILTVLIMESTSASNRSNVATKKGSKLDIGGQEGTGVLKFVPGLGLVGNMSADYTGEGSTVRQQQIQARMSVTVVGVKPNGDLLVEGSRTININGEQEVVYLSGAVNSLIIPADNTIESHRISDLQVSYKGKGVVSEGARPGLLIRFFNWVF